MSEILKWLHETGILTDVASGVLVTIIIAILAFVSRNTIVAFVKRLLPRLESKTPHINFEVKNHKKSNGEWESTVTVSNAGNEPAYNIYVFYFEQFVNDSFKIKASDMKNLITRPVLGIRDSLEFKTNGVHFDGCNVTSIQEIWIEYENSLGVAFRVVSEPGSPRGDVAKIRPPQVIKHRLEQLPGASKEGTKRELAGYKKGKSTLFPRVGKLSILKWHFITRPRMRLQDWRRNKKIKEN